MQLSIEDKQLLNRCFTANWERVDSASSSLPLDWQGAEIIETYDLRTPSNSRPVMCSFKGRHRHGRGYIARSPSGAIFRVGKTCGAKEFKLSWTNIHKDFDHQLKRQAYLKELLDLTPLLFKALEFLRSSDLRNALQYLESTTKAFLEFIEPIRSNLIQGYMPFETKEEDKEATDRKRRAHQEQLDKIEELFESGKIVAADREGRLKRARSTWTGKPVLKVVTANFCPADFKGNFLLLYKQRLKKMEAANINLSKVYVETKKTKSGNLTNEGLRRLRDKIRAAAREWDENAAVFEEFSGFFSVANLSTIVRWSQQNGVDFDVTLSGGHIRYVDMHTDAAILIPKNKRIDFSTLHKMVLKKKR